MKILQGNVVSSSGVNRQQIYYDPQTGIINNITSTDQDIQNADDTFGEDFLIFPGMGDIHVHVREDVSKKHNHKEDFTSASQAALNGGVTFIMDMPNNPIPPIDDQSYIAKNELTNKSLIPAMLYAGIGPKTNPLSFEVPYKVYMGPSIGDLFFKDDQGLDQTLSRYNGKCVSFHCEDYDILMANKNEKFHHTRRPPEAEIEAVKKAIYLTEKYNLKTIICHCSTAKSVELINKAKNKGLKIKVEVAPHHLYFSQEKVKDKIVFFQVNPPIRSEEERTELLQHFIKGNIDYLATDHAPHMLKEKQQNISGLTGLDSYGDFVTWLLLDQHTDPKIIVKTCCENPGTFFNQFLHLVTPFSTNAPVGFIKQNYVASFTVIDLKTKNEFKKRALKSKAQHTPYNDTVFPGTIHQVYNAGRLTAP